MAKTHSFSAARLAVLAPVLAGVSACADVQAPVAAGSIGDGQAATDMVAADLVPSPLALATLGGRSFAFWPFTGTSFDGTRQDPVNLIFFGQADPRQIRAALASLDGDRTSFGFPAAFPFDCTWNDALGGMQTAYASDAGWIGNAIQMECGPYGPIRFHLRLFRAMGATIGNAHIDLQIPGTHDHQVISWALAQQLVTVDMARTGLLGSSPALTEPTHGASFGEINPLIYNGLPPEVRFMIGGPPDNVSAPVPIRSIGRATQLELAGRVPVVPDEQIQDFVVDWNQTIPKPFCAAGPGHLIHVQGPLRLRQRSGIDAAGEYHMEMIAEGLLRVTPVTPPAGSSSESYDAGITVIHTGTVTDPMTRATRFQLQKELPADGPWRGTLRNQLRVGPTPNASRFSLDIDC